MHIVPSSVVDAFADGRRAPGGVLRRAVRRRARVRSARRGRPLTDVLDRLSQVFFRIVAIVMKVAPIGAFGAMAYTIGTFGVKSLLPLGRLMLDVYLTMALFIFVVLNLILRLLRLLALGVPEVHPRGDPDRARHVVERGGAAADARQDGAVRLRAVGGGAGDSGGVLVQPRRDVDLPVDGGDLHRAGVRRRPVARRSSSACSAC